MKKRAILVIGAGAAGLTAANELANEYEVTILEALDRIGGRIHTIEDPLSAQLVEAGPEFIHGQLPLTLGLVEKAGLTLQPISGKMYRVSHCDWKEENEMVDGWEDMLEKMKLLPEDLTLDAFLETYYPYPDQEDLRRQARSYAAGFDLADPVMASAKALYNEWTHEEDKQYRIKEGYSAVMRYLHEQCVEKGCRILTGKKVTQLNWKKGLVTALTSDGEKYNASKVIVTLPAGVMKKTAAKSAIAFTPAIDNYIEAFRKIGYGSVLKIALRFYAPFWKHIPDMGFMISDEMIPTWWTQMPDESPVLTGWLGGPAAVQWSGIADETILDHAVSSLASIFKLTPEDIRRYLLSHHIFNWHTVQTAYGAYSYETPLSAEARELLNQPLEDTLYFAGEALYEGNFPGTVEAALSSGMSVAKNIQEEVIFQDRPAQKISV